MTTFTIITSSLNALSLLEKTASSIFQQSFPAWQWIIIDGASTDGTAEWLRRTCGARRNCFFISEPDRGIYDAWNKALPLVTGDWVVFLGAGDRFKSHEVLELCARLLAEVPEHINLAYGDAELTNSGELLNGTPVKHRWEGVSGRWAWGRPRLPQHQSIFHRSRMFQNGAGFDPTYRIAGDVAILLPEFLLNGGFEIHIATSLVLSGGVSGDPSNRPLLLRENLRANREAGLFWTRIHYQVAALIYHHIKSGILAVRDRWPRSHQR